MSLLMIIFLINSTGIPTAKSPGGTRIPEAKAPGGCAECDSLKVRTVAVTTSEPPPEEENVLEYTFGMNTYTAGFNRASISTNIPEENINVSNGTLELKIKLLSLPMRGGNEFPLYLIYRGSPLSLPDIVFSDCSDNPYVECPPSGYWGSRYGTPWNYEHLGENSYIVSGDMGNCGLGWNVMPGELSIHPEQRHPCCGGGCTSGIGDCSLEYHPGPCCVGSRTGYVNLNGSTYELSQADDEGGGGLLLCTYTGDGKWFILGRPDFNLDFFDGNPSEWCWQTLASELYTPDYSYYFSSSGMQCTDYWEINSPTGYQRKLYFLEEMVDHNGNYVNLTWWDDPGQYNNGSNYIVTPPARRIPQTICTPTDTCYIYRKSIVPDTNVGLPPEEVYCTWDFFVIDSVVKDINGEHFVVNFYYHQEWYDDVMEYWYGHQFILLDSVEFLKDGERIKPPYRFEYSGSSGLSGELTSFTTPDGANYSYTYLTVDYTYCFYDFCPDPSVINPPYHLTKYRRIRDKLVDLPEPKEDIYYIYDYPVGDLSVSSVGPECGGRAYTPEYGVRTYYPIYKSCNVSMADEVHIAYTFVDSTWVSDHIAVEKRPEPSPIDMFNMPIFAGNIFPSEKEQFYGKLLKIVKSDASGLKELTQFHYVLGDKIAPDIFGSVPLHPVLRYKFVQNNPNNHYLEDGERVKLYHYKEYDEYDNVKKQEFLGEVDYKEVADISNEILTFGDPSLPYMYQEWENKNLPGYENDDYADNWEMRKSYLHESDDDYEDEEIALYHLEDTIEKFKKTGSSSWELVSKAEFEYDNTVLTDIDDPILHHHLLDWYIVYDVNFTTRGNLTKKTEYINENEETRSQEYWYDICGNLVKMRDYMENEYEFDYCPAYVFPDTLEYPDGSIEDFDFDKKGRLVEVTDKNGIMVQFTYDIYGRLTEYRKGDPADLNRLGLYEYYDFERWARTWSYYNNFDADVTNYYYDEMGRLEESKRSSMVGEDIIKEYFYDRKGNLNKETVPRFENAVEETHAVEKEFDVLNRVVEIKYPSTASPEIVEYVYNGDITEVYDELEYKTTLINDASGNLIEVEDALFNNTYYEYDVNGNLLSIEDAEGKFTYFEYDWLGNLVRREGPDRGVDTFAYDANGNTIYHMNNFGYEIEFTYDQLDRITSKSVNDVEEETYYYDSYDNIGGDNYEDQVPSGLEYSNGRLTGFQNADVREVYFYDKFGNIGEKLVISLTGSIGEQTLKYSYDLKGRLTKLDYPGEYKVEYDYDNFDNISSVEINDGETVNLSSTATGLLSGVYFPGGVVKDEFAYTPRNWMESMEIYSISDWYQRGFEYNERGELNRIWYWDYSLSATQVTEAEYTYDALGRLRIEDREGDDNDHDFEYYDDGNRYIVDGDEYTYHTDDLGRKTNKLFNDGPNTYDYNDIGCISSKSNVVDGATNFYYDAEGRLTGVALPDGVNGYKYYYKGNKRIREEKLTDIDIIYTPEGFLYSCKLKWELLPEAVLEAVFLNEDNNELGTLTLVSGQVLWGTHDWEWEEFSGVITNEDFLPGTSTAKLRVRIVESASGTHLWVGNTSIDAIWDDGYISGGVVEAYNYFYDNVGNLIIVDDDSPNILENSGFETGDKTDWSKWPPDASDWTVIMSSPQEGKYSLYSSESNSSMELMLQHNSLEEVSNTFTASAWVKTSSLTGGVKVMVDFWSADWSQSFGGKSSNILTGTTDDWTEISVTINPGDIPSGAVNFKFHIVRLPGTGNFKVDNARCESGMTRTPETKYIYAGKRLLAKEEDGELFFYHLDRLGSPIMITDESSNIVKEKKYEAFGNLIWEEGTYEDNREFTSKEKDPTGFHYFGARYYYGNIGRFLSPDPHTLMPGNLNLANSQELNPYVYCYNNPVNLIDPEGLYAFKPTDDKIVGGMMRTAFQHSEIVRSSMIGAKNNTKIVVTFKRNDQLNSKAHTHSEEGWKDGTLDITVELNWQEIGTNPADHTEVVAHELKHVEELSETKNNKGIQEYKKNKAKSGCTQEAEDTGKKARGQFNDKSNEQYKKMKKEELNQKMFTDGYKDE